MGAPTSGRIFSSVLANKHSLLGVVCVSLRVVAGCDELDVRRLWAGFQWLVNSLPASSHYTAPIGCFSSFHFTHGSEVEYKGRRGLSVRHLADDAD